jgi:hypothetical protein
LNVHAASIQTYLEKLVGRDVAYNEFFPALAFDGRQGAVVPAFGKCVSVPVVQFTALSIEGLDATVGASLDRACSLAKCVGGRAAFGAYSDVQETESIYWIVASVAVVAPTVLFAIRSTCRTAKLLVLARKES